MTRMVATRRRTAPFRGGVSLVVALLAAGSIACQSAESKFCAAACPHWITCTQAGSVSCANQDLESLCESTCNQVASELGDSESAFLDCASCTLPYVGDEVCDMSDDSSAGSVACADTCNDPLVGPAASDFYSSFASSFASAVSNGAAPDGTRCSTAADCCSGTCTDGTCGASSSGGATCARAGDCSTGCCAPVAASGQPYVLVGPYVCQEASACCYDTSCPGSDAVSCCVTDTIGNQFCAQPCTDDAACGGTATCAPYSFEHSGCAGLTACGPR